MRALHRIFVYCFLLVYRTYSYDISSGFSSGVLHEEYKTYDINGNVINSDEFVFGVLFIDIMGSKKFTHFSMFATQSLGVIDLVFDNPVFHNSIGITKGLAFRFVRPEIGFGYNILNYRKFDSKKFNDHVDKGRGKRVIDHSLSIIFRGSFFKHFKIEYYYNLGGGYRKHYPLKGQLRIHYIW